MGSRSDPLPRKRKSLEFNWLFQTSRELGVLERGWALGLAVVVAIPISEELLYRGLLLGRFRKHGYLVSGTLISTIVPRRFLDSKNLAHRIKTLCVVPVESAVDCRPCSLSGRLPD